MRGRQREIGEGRERVQSVCDGLKTHSEKRERATLDEAQKQGCTNERSDKTALYTILDEVAAVGLY
jgi:hypothetical protein